MRHSLQRLLLIGSTVLCISCSNDSLDVNSANVLGTWAEDYSQYPYFASDGGAYYTFNSDGTLDIHTYDVFAGDGDIQKTWSLDNKNGDVIVLSGTVPVPDHSEYRIIKLTKKEMEWQKVGTSFSQGTLSSDFKHFIRSSGDKIPGSAK